MSIKRLHVNARMSQILIHNQIVYLAGQVSRNARNHPFADQMKDVLQLIENLLAEANSDKGHILSATVWLTDMSDFPEMNNIWETWVEAGSVPTRTTVESPRLASPEVNVEISVIAARRSASDSYRTS